MGAVSTKPQRARKSKAPGCLCWRPVHQSAGSWSDAGPSSHHEQRSSPATTQNNSTSPVVQGVLNPQQVLEIAQRVVGKHMACAPPPLAAQRLVDKLYSCSQAAQQLAAELASDTLHGPVCDLSPMGPLPLSPSSSSNNVCLGDSGLLAIFPDHNGSCTVTTAATPQPCKAHPSASSPDGACSHSELHPDLSSHLPTPRERSIHADLVAKKVSGGLHRPSPLDTTHVHSHGLAPVRQIALEPACCPLESLECEVDPVVVATLYLINGRQATIQLPSDVVHWLSCEVGYDAYGSPPPAHQMATVECNIYLCAAFCQIVSLHLSRLGLGEGAIPSHMPQSPVDAQVAAVIRTVRELSGAETTQPVNEFSRISAMWQEAGVIMDPGFPPPRPPLPAGGPGELWVLVGAYGVHATRHHLTQPVGPHPHLHLPPPPQQHDLYLQHTAAKAAWEKFHPALLLVQRLASSLAVRAAAAAASGRSHSRPSSRQHSASGAAPFTQLCGGGGMEEDGPVVMYMCGAGDTLASIAAAAQLSEAQVLEANPGLGAEVALRACDCLALPVASILPRLYCMQPQDTLCTVASQHTLSLHRLLSVNPGARKLNPRVAQPGFLLEIPGLYGV